MIIASLKTALLLLGLTSISMACSVTDSSGNDITDSIVSADGTTALCDDRRECYRATIDGCDEVQCTGGRGIGNGDSSCEEATITNAITVICHEDQACQGAYITARDGAENTVLECLDDEACRFVDAIGFQSIVCDTQNANHQDVCEYLEVDGGTITCTEQETSLGIYTCNNIRGTPDCIVCEGEGSCDNNAEEYGCPSEEEEEQE